MTVESELIALTNEAGFINPRYGVQWARENPDSALHKQLEWDDAKAAEEHRVSQVRRLIAIHITADDGRRATISLIQDRNQDGGYRHMPAVLGNAELRAMAVRQALRELRRIEQRYRWLNELAGVFAEVGRIEQSGPGEEAA